MLFHLFRILPFISPDLPYAFSLIQFHLRTPPLSNPLSCVQLLLTSSSFSTAVEYYTSLNPFISWYSSLIPPFPSLLSFTHFFLSLHTSASSSDSHFTVINGNPSKSSFSHARAISISLLHPPPRSSSTPRLISPPLD